MSVVEDEFGGVKSRVELFEKLASSPAKKVPSSVVLASPTGQVKEVVHKLTTPTKVSGPRCENRDPQALLASCGKVKDSLQKLQEQADGATKRRKIETPSLEATASATAENFPEGLEQYSLSSMWAPSDDAKQSDNAKPQDDGKGDVQTHTKPAAAPMDEHMEVPAGLEQYSLTPEVPAKQEEEVGHRKSTDVPAGLESYSLNLAWGQDEECSEKQRDRDEPSEENDANMVSACSAENVSEKDVPMCVQSKEMHDEDSYEIDGLVQEASDDLKEEIGDLKEVSDDLKEANDLKAEATSGKQECVSEHKTSSGEEGVAVHVVSISGAVAALEGADEDEEQDPVLIQTASDCLQDAGNDESIAMEFEKHDRESALRAAREKDEADGFQDALEGDGFDLLRKANGGVRHASAGHTPITRSLVPSTRSGKKRKASDLEVDGL